MEITVQQDTIVAIVPKDTLSWPIKKDQYLTVNDLFAFIEDAMRPPEARVEVSYDKQWGYPERIFVDRNPSLIDDEVAYVTSISGLPPGPD